MQAILNFPNSIELPHWSYISALGILFLVPMERESVPVLSFEHQEVLSVLNRKLPAEYQYQSAEIAKTLMDSAKEHQIAPSLILAVMETESSFRPWAKSKAGALGLMQLLPATAEEIAKDHNIAYRSDTDLLDPRINLQLGIAYLAHLKSRFSEKNHYLAAYNLGPTALKKRHSRGDYSLGIMKNYVTKIRMRERIYSGTSLALR